MKRACASILDRLHRGGKGVLAPAILGALALAGCAQEAVQEQPAPSPLLYEITGPQGDVEGWMLGTIHALPDGVDWRTDAIDRVIDDADLLVVEIAELDDREKIAAIFVELALSPGLPALEQRVSPSERPALLDLVRRAGRSADEFTATETWAAAFMLAQVGAQGDPENGVDRIVIREFANRDVREFEGAVDQLTIFDTLPEEDQREMLSGVVEESTSLKDDPGRLRRAWLTGNIEALELATTTGVMEDAELRAAILINRNRNWIRKLSAMLRAPEKPLVAVGAAHLVGEDGLPELLEERGYTVRSLH
ncbi:MAG: TraB/GumN family protein [Pseudomonadota bacterium]